MGSSGVKRGETSGELREALNGVSRYCLQKVRTSTGAMVRCGTRNAYWCPGCAKLYAYRWWRIGKSGMLDAGGQVLNGFTFVFLTLTLPGFGKVHNYVKPSRRKGMAKRNRCCQYWHGKRDRLVGFPVIPEMYDRRLAILANQNIGVLFDKLMTALRRAFGEEFAHFSVVEIQARGARHYHVLLRIQDERFDIAKLYEVLGRERQKISWQGDVLKLGEEQDVKVLGREELCGEGRGKSLKRRDPLSYMVKQARYMFKSVNAVTTEVSQMSKWLHEYARLEFRCSPQCVPGVCGEAVHENPIDPREPFGKSRNWSLTGLTMESLKAESRRWRCAEQELLEGELSEEELERLNDERARKEGVASGRYLMNRARYYLALEGERRTGAARTTTNRVREAGVTYDVHGERL